MKSEPLAVAEVERRLTQAFHAKNQLITVDDRGYESTPRRPDRGRLLPLAAAVTVLVIVSGYLLVTSMHAQHAPTDSDPVRLPAISTVGTTVDPLKPAPASQLAFVPKTARPLHVTDAERGGSNYSFPWHFLALLDGGRTLLINYELGDPCDQPLGMKVQQGSNAVELTALSNVDHNGCEQSLLVGFGTVRLDAPLGKRLLLHAPIDRH